MRAVVADPAPDFVPTQTSRACQTTAPDPSAFARNEERRGLTPRRPWALRDSWLSTQSSNSCRSAFAGWAFMRQFSRRPAVYQVSSRGIGCFSGSFGLTGLYPLPPRRVFLDLVLAL